WNGTRWQVVRSPRPSTKSGTSAVEAIATDRTGEVWAVGGRVRGFGEAGRPDGGIVEHSTPTGFVSAPAPNGVLTAVAHWSDQDVFAFEGGCLTTAGTYGAGANRLLKWEGRRWRALVF